MTEAEAQAFAAQWISAWNSRDLDRILQHYSEDIEVTSPLIARVLGPGKDTVRGKPALRAYWGPALKQFPELEFQLFKALSGVGSVVLYYRSVRGLLGAEYMQFDAAGKVCRVIAHYTQGPETGG